MGGCAISSASLSKHAFKDEGGLCDSLLLSTFSAWDYRKKWIILAPAMNTYMWCNYVIEEVVTYFKERSQVQKHKISIVEPSEKLLACGDIERGRWRQCLLLLRK